MADYVDKIAKLMAKAESSQFPAEADAFLVKAQELMTEYSIDEAMLREARGREDVVEQIEERSLSYTGGMRKVLKALGHRIADANGARSFWRKGRRYPKPRQPGQKLPPHSIDVVVIGFPKDLDRIEMLNTSLTLQCMTALSKFSKEHIDPSWHRAAKRNEKREFVLGFVNGVTKKMALAVSDAEEKAAGTHGPGVALAIRSRTDQVNDWTDTRYPSLRTTHMRIQRGTGTARAAGSIAGTRADIGQGGIAGQKELSS